MIIRRLHVEGEAAIVKGGITIPAEVVLEKDGRMEGGLLKIDRIWIERIRGGAKDGEYRVTLHEDGDGGEGGGIFGDLLDETRKDKDGKKRDFYPCIKYDKIRDGDVYYLPFSILLSVWSKYLQEVRGRQEVSSAASIARSKNMQKAREARLAQKKHLKTHFG